jgi:single-strand DNA-binding protein
MPNAKRDVSRSTMIARIMRDKACAPLAVSRGGSSSADRAMDSFGAARRGENGEFFNSERRKLMSAGGVNIAILVGRATSDPTVRVVKGGVAQAVFNMTTNEVYFNKETNERREKVMPHRVVVYGPLANAVGKCVRKGCLVFVQGQIETRRWVGKDGSRGENWTTEIVCQGWSGRVTVLAFAGELVRAEADAEDFGASPTPLSIARSAARYGDGLDAEPDQSDKIDPTMPFLG